MLCMQQARDRLIAFLVTRLGHGEPALERRSIVEAVADAAIAATRGDVDAAMGTLAGGDPMADTAIANDHATSSAATNDDLFIPPAVKDRYAFTGREIGRGGLRRVREAVDRGLGREVAIN